MNTLNRYASEGIKAACNWAYKRVANDSVLRGKTFHKTWKHKRSREWVVVNMVKIEALKKRNVDNKKLIFNGVNQYTNEYQAQQKKIIQLRCEAGLKCSLIRMTISGSETATNSRT
ncbi:60S ribosomal protein L7-4-like protein, partial [Tanacetum coccineum]